MADVRLEGVGKSYGAVEVLKDVSLEILDGEFLILVGPSGCGKSTLLRAISGLEPVSVGNIRVGGEDMTGKEPVERGVGMVFQSYALYPHMTVEQNIGFGLRIARRDRGEIRDTVRSVAEMLKLDHLLDRKPRELSGGQRQRVAIGRSLARRPRIFLFDEPLSNLDAALRVEMRVELSKLHGELQSTMIYVTHDQVEAMTMADRIAVMDHGKIMQVGTPLELFNAPRNRFVAGFLGQPSTNFLQVLSASQGGNATTYSVPGGAVTFGAVAPGASDAIEVGLRPDAFDVAPEGDGDLTGTVELAEQLGDETLVHVRLEGDVPVVAKLKGQHLLMRGQRLGLRVDCKAPMAFSDQGINVFAA